MERDDLEMMKNPKLWPIPNLLPLKHKTERKNGGWPKLATLTTIKTADNKFLVLEETADLLSIDSPRREYNSLEEVAAEYYVD